MRVLDLRTLRTAALAAELTQPATVRSGSIEPCGVTRARLEAYLQKLDRGAGLATTPHRAASGDAAKVVDIGAYLGRKGMEVPR